MARLDKVRETRIGRSTFEYEFKSVVRNDGTVTASEVVAKLLYAPTGVQILDGLAVFDSMGAGETVSSQDTVVLRFDRSIPFDPSALAWQVGRSIEPLTAVVAIATTVPAAARSQVVAAVSTEATGQADSAMPIGAPGPAGGSTVFAVDGEGNATTLQVMGMQLAQR